MSEGTTEAIEPTITNLPATVIKETHNVLASELVARLKGMLEASPTLIGYNVSSEYLKRESIKLKSGSRTIEIQITQQD